MMTIWWWGKKKSQSLVMAWWWRLEDMIRHPVLNYRDRHKWRHRPKPGDRVEDCRRRLLTVVAYGDTEDDLVFEDGMTASWMHCCNWPEDRKERRWEENDEGNTPAG